MISKVKKSNSVSKYLNKNIFSLIKKNNILLQIENMFTLSDIGHKVAYKDNLKISCNFLYNYICNAMQWKKKFLRITKRTSSLLQNVIGILGK